MANIAPSPAPRIYIYGAGGLNEKNAKPSINGRFIMRKNAIALVFMVIATCVISCGGQGKDWSKENARSELAIAKEIWAANSVANYKIDFEVYPRFYDADIEKAEAEYASRELINLTVYKSGRNDGEEVDIESDHMALMYIREITEMFDWIEEIIDSNPYELEVSYDGKYGFPTEIVLQIAPPSVASDTYSRYLYHNLKFIE